jgi:hypothetical protein
MIIFYNPHIDDFCAEPVHFRILRRRALKKYGFVFDEIIKSGQSLNILIDASISGLIPSAIFGLLPYFVRRPLAEIEYAIWKKINKFGPSLKRVVPTKENSPDILIAFSYKSAVGRFGLRRNLLSRYRATIFHLSHYFVDTSEKAANIRSLPNAILAGDSDITSIPYFQKWFDWYDQPFLILPFAVQRRFQNIRTWGARENKAVAMGSYHELEMEKPARRYADYIETTGETTYHPIRKAIHSSVETHDKWISSRVSPYRDYKVGRLKSLTRHFLVSQKGYFAIDIVDLYNSFRYAVVGEELSGFPALGAFEAIACGCVLIAQSRYYDGLGLESGVHYVEYSGEIMDLVEKISELQTRSLEKMSAEAAVFIQREYSSSAVWQKWTAQWQKIK